MRPIWPTLDRKSTYPAVQFCRATSVLAMPDIKFPPSVEIKRAIAAAERAGVRIKSIEIHPRKIIIFVTDNAEETPKDQTYAEWKAERGL